MGLSGLFPEFSSSGLLSSPGVWMSIGSGAQDFTPFHQGASSSHTHTWRLSPWGASPLVRALPELPVKPEI